MYVHNLLPLSFERAWITNLNRRENEDIPNLRNDQDIDEPYARTNFAQKMPLSYFPKIWNKLNNLAKYDPNITIFCCKIKASIFEELRQESLCNRPNCPSCP
jgi:hypothetical protein